MPKGYRTDSTLTPWDEDRHETVRRLWLEGVNATDIAERIGGTSRNAVMGLVHRKGWERAEAVNERSRAEARSRAGAATRSRAAEATKEWPAAHVVRLTDLRRAGRSASEIARGLNAEFPGSAYSRVAVTAKCMRLGLRADVQTQANNHKRLSPPPTPASKPSFTITGNGTVTERAVAAPSPFQPRADAWRPLDGSDPIRLEDRKAFQCRWPVGDEIGVMCGCAAPTDRYCPRHDEMSVSPKAPTPTSDLIRSARRFGA